MEKVERQIKIKGIVKYRDSFLIVEKWYDDRVPTPYQWEFLDGDLEYGESPEKAAVRIIFENTGLNTKIKKVLYTWSYMKGDIHCVGIAFLCDADVDQIILSETFNEYAWIGREEFGNYIENSMLLNDIEKVKDSI